MITNFAHHSWEFGKEFSKGICLHALTLAPMLASKKFANWAGYGTQFAETTQGVSGVLHLASGLNGLRQKSSTALQGRVKEIRASSLGKDVLQVATGVALLADTFFPSSVTPLAIGAVQVVSGVVNMCSGTSAILEGMKKSQDEDINWAKVSQGVIIYGLGGLSLHSGVNTLLREASNPSIPKEPINVKPSSRVKPSSGVDRAAFKAEFEKNPKLVEKMLSWKNSSGKPFFQTVDEFLDYKDLYKHKWSHHFCYSEPDLIRQEVVRGITIREAINSFDQILKSETYFSSFSETFPLFQMNAQFISPKAFETVKDRIMEMDSRATSDSITEFFFPSNTDKENIFSCKDLMFYDYPALTEEEGRNILVQLYLTKDRALYENYKDFAENLGCTGYPSFLKALSENISKFTKHQFDFIKKFSKKEHECENLTNMVNHGIPANPFIVQASADHNGALGAPLHPPVSNVREVCSALYDTVKKTGKLIDFLVISGHGTPHSIQLDNRNDIDESNIQIVANCVKDTVSKDGTIYLGACSTGKNVSPSRNIAQQLSLKTGLEVMAPDNIFSSASCSKSFAPSGKKLNINCNTGSYPAEILSFTPDSIKASNAMDQTPMLERIGNFVQYMLYT